MKTKRLFFSALLPFILAAAGTQTVFAQEVLTIDDAVQLALDNNLNLKISAIDIGTRKRASNRSWNELIPSLSASTYASHRTSLTGPVEPEDQNVWSYGFSLSAGLTVSASIINNIKKASNDYELGLLNYETARQELELQVRKLFYQILLLDANRELAVQNFASAQAMYEQSAALVRVGQAPQLDELSARVDMENTRPAVRSAQTLYENALDSFVSILGMPAGTSVSLDGSLEGGIAGNLTSAKDNAGESLETAVLVKSIRSLELQRNAVKSGAYIPYLRLSWDSSPVYNRNANTSDEVSVIDAPAQKKWNDSTGSFRISLGLNIDNFLPWSSTKTQIDNINDNISAAQIQLADNSRSRENRISQNMRTVEGILESLEAMELNVELAQLTYNMYTDAYRRGAADYQQVRGAVDSLEQTKNRLLQEQYSLIAALLELEKELNIPFGTLFINEQ